jgi:hypothetical protein
MLKAELVAVKKHECRQGTTWPLERQGGVLTVTVKNITPEDVDHFLLVVSNCGIDAGYDTARFRIELTGT